MNYKRNESGEVMVRTSKGVAKYIPEKLANDSQLMKAMHLEVVEAPVAFKSEDFINENLPEKAIDEPVEEQKIEETKVAETVPAKKNAKNTK